MMKITYNGALTTLRTADFGQMWPQALAEVIDAAVYTMKLARHTAADLKQTAELSMELGTIKHAMRATVTVLASTNENVSARAQEIREAADRFNDGAEVFGNHVVAAAREAVKSELTPAVKEMREIATRVTSSTTAVKTAVEDGKTSIAKSVKEGAEALDARYRAVSRIEKSVKLMLAGMVLLTAVQVSVLMLVTANTSKASQGYPQAEVRR